ncbi:TPA: hypothetical protein G8W59_004245 [Salmonella enterica]|uniref:Uncharacterized protein n=1 Tax=Salmonella enterica TaxID=28901 RepID=A0A759KBG2_SALER|nr:hypothetical protein [Salmonella enterica]
MPNIIHRSSITNPQKRGADVRKIEEQSVNQQASTKQPDEYVWEAAKGQPLPSLSYTSGQSIRENYSSRRGDLLYGLGEHRFKLLQNIYPGTQLKDIPIQYIDSMNYAKMVCAQNAANDEHTNFRKEYNSSENVDAYIHTMRQQDAISEKDPKFNVRKRFEDFYELEKKIKDAQNPDKDLHLLSREYYKIIKRGCKAGIMSATLDSSNHHIHFSLDGIDMNSVVTKNSSYSPIGMPSYTGVELRCAYRLKEQLKDKLHFYENGVKVSAPWEREPELWRKYIPKGH